MNLSIIQGDALTELQKLPSDSAHCVVTSPPYWGLRDYNVPGQIGLEKTPDGWCAKLVEVFREVRRILHPTGVLFLNVGDGYSSGDRATWRSGVSDNKGQQVLDDMPRPKTPPGLKAKDLLGLPWLLAFALRSDGWYLRQEIIWHKPNAMPESVTDRCAKAHEQIFLLTKSAQYFFDAEAIKEPVTGGSHPRREGANSKMSIEHAPGKENSKPNPSRYSRKPTGWDTGLGSHNKLTGYYKDPGVTPKSAPAGSRNKRSVWTIATEPYPDAHHATFPTALVTPCILAGTSARGVCPTCLAPYERIVEDGARDLAHQRACGGNAKGEYHGQSTKDYASAKAQDASATKARILAGMVEKKTIGWEPTCSCSPEPCHDCDPCLGGRPDQCAISPTLKPIPATVLDPFFGSGTTGQVALELGRFCIGIELSEDYVKLARERCASVTPGLPNFA